MAVGLSLSPLVLMTFRLRPMLVAQLQVPPSLGLCVSYVRSYYAIEPTADRM